MSIPYTRSAQEVLRLAAEAAREAGSGYIGTEHLLVGMVQEPDGVASRILRENGLTQEKLQQMMESLRGGAGATTLKDRDGYSPRLRGLLDGVQELAARYGMKEAGTELFLMAVILEKKNVALKLMSAAGLNITKIYYEVLAAMGEDLQAHRNDLEDHPEESGGAESGEGAATPLLDQFSRNLTEMAKRGDLDPVVGRNEEMDRVIRILSRRTKNNPCLIGEPGVGKTAIVEGLAQRIVRGEVPSSMMNRQILMLDLAGVVAGTKYRGEFEERIKGIVDELKGDRSRILFIDEMHTLIGAGGAEGALDASNILKPALSRGEIQVIGATTIAEFRKYVEKDAALERRFQQVLVEEPTAEESVRILQGILPRYEEYHRVHVRPEALDEAVRLSERYITDRNLPDKAIDVIDEACAAASIGAPQKKRANPLTSIEDKMEQADEELADAVMAMDLAAARKARKRYTKLEAQYLEARDRQDAARQETLPEVTPEDIADVVSRWTGVPVTRLSQREGERLLHLEDELHKRVIGQEDAIRAVSKAIRRGRVGLQDPNRPIGTFLFLGPTGVGKTELAKALAEAVFGDEKDMIRLDMSEYMEQYAGSKMIGSAPGYVGFEEGGQLTDKVRKNPYTVVLFDEIEKAHPDIFNMLLQILDEGRLTDSRGRQVNFRNTIIIMTSNVGARGIVEPKSIGFSPKPTLEQAYDKMQAGVMDAVKKAFRPEFINRIDGIEVFHALSRDELIAITTLLTNDLARRAKDQLGITVRVSSSMKKHLVDTYADAKMGARPLKRAIQTVIEDELSLRILSGEFRSGDVVTVGYSRGEATFKKAQPKEHRGQEPDTQISDAQMPDAQGDGTQTLPVKAREPETVQM